jgi:hypothetical protein
MEDFTMTLSDRPLGRLSVLGAAIGVGVALVGLFLVCALVEAVVPDLPATHAWIALFTAADPSSMRAWLEGILYSAIFGALAGVLFGVSYNATLGRS